MPESQKDSIVHPDSKTKAQTHIKHGLRQKKGIYPGRLGSYAPSGVIQRKVCEGGTKNSYFSRGRRKKRGGGIRDLDGKNSSKKFTVYYQSRAERSVRHLRQSSSFNTLSEINCPPFLPFGHYFGVGREKEKKQKSMFDIIGFHFEPSRQ